jgi:hypothetical protein
MHTLVGAARVIEDTTEDEVERWANGVRVYPYPAGTAESWDAQAGGSNVVAKSYGGIDALPEFRAMVAFVGERCTAAGIWGGGLTEAESQARFVGRATRVLEATESWAVERELMSGALLGGYGQPYLADTNADLLASGAAVSVKEGFARLENAIAETGKQGWIHCSPGAVLLAGGLGIVWRDDRGPAGAPVLRTVNGTITVPGMGYVGASKPASGSAPNDHEEWMYATGPVELRRSRAILLPDQVSQALDRGNNDISYLVERYYVADWDTELQAAVLVDWRA